jgi:N-dimethylarginine dimethylaminohydrolase
MVFPANAAVVLDGRALLARFQHAERRGEEPHFRAIFEDLRARGLLREVAQLPRGCFQEGAGDCIWDAARNLFWAGWGPRSSREAVDAITAFFGRDVVPLELASERCYHLDVGFCVLGGGHILYLPAALTPEAQDSLRARVAPEWLIEATEEDLLHFNVNAVCLGHTVMMSLGTPRLRATLQARGYRVVEVDLGPFMLSGGGAFCMTLNLSQRSRRSRRITVGTPTSP